MTRLLSNFVDILAKEVHKVKCKHWHDKNNGEAGGLKYEGYEGCLA